MWLAGPGRVSWTPVAAAALGKGKEACSGGPGSSPVEAAGSRSLELGGSHTGLSHAQGGWTFLLLCGNKSFWERVLGVSILSLSILTHSRTSVVECGGAGEW
jgi:hypothetical protein